MPLLTELEKFVALSKILTGEEKLDTAIATRYLERFKQAYPTDWQQIVSAFDSVQTSPDLKAKLGQLLRREQTLGQAARRLILLWYTAELTLPDGKQQGPETEEQYRSAVMYCVIGAFAPGFSEAPYEYWKTKPNLE
jgi:Membrane bound FAD containing D-sorbitol dehydrogenase